MLNHKTPKVYQKVERATVNAWPFTLFSDPPNQSLAIIIHGFTSSAYEGHDLAQYLSEKRVDVQAVLMAGHGGSFEYLASAGKEEWFESIEKVLKQNSGKYKNIFLIGYSFGANMALHLAKLYPEITGLVSLGLPIFIRKEKKIRFFLPLARIFKKRYRKNWVDKDQIALAATGRHKDIPIKCIVDFYSFIDNYTKKELGEVEVPILILHARDDMVSDPVSSEYLYRHIASQDKTMYILNKDSHNLVHDSRRDFVFARIHQFMEKNTL